VTNPFRLNENRGTTVETPSMTAKLVSQRIEKIVCPFPNETESLARKVSPDREHEESPRNRCRKFTINFHRWQFYSSY
jgi:hypothetical protein